MPTLPIYQLDPSVQERSEPERLSRELFARRDVEVTVRGPLARVRGSDAFLDLDFGRGGVWAGDVKRLYSREPADLPGRKALRAIGRDSLKRTRILPDLTGPFRLQKAEIHFNHSASRGPDGKRVDSTPTATYARDVVVDVGDRDDVPGDTLPLFGGGGRFRATIGDRGEVVGAMGVWRAPDQVDERQIRSVEEVVRAAQAEAGEGVRVLGATLGYYSAPAFSGQELMFPVYAVRRQVELDGRVFSMRTTFEPASDVGSIPQPEHPQGPRAKETPIRPRRFRPEQIQPGLKLPAGQAIDLNALKDLNLGGLLHHDDVIQLGPKLDPEVLHAIIEARRPRSGGASWIGNFDWSKLGGSAGNAQGFVDGIAGLGWQVPFNWGNGNAWITDWREDDDAWVDNVDFVFYTGHADMNGWVLADGAGHLTGFDFSSVGNSPSEMSDLWGRNNLEWMVIAACGPHQDEVISAGGGDVLARWDGAFDGLHQMFGYGSVTSDNTEEGKRVVQYARDGMTLREAWFRTAQEIQNSPNGYPPPDGPTIWASAMSIADAGGGTGDDHLWGFGSTYSDVRDWTNIGCDWVAC